MEMNSKARFYSIFGITFILVGMYALSSYLSNRIREADGKIIALTAQAKGLQAERDKIGVSLDESNLKYADALRESAKFAAIARKAKIPPPAPPAPKTVEELTIPIRVALSQEALVVADPNRASILNQADGEKVFTYFEEAKRTSGFEAKVLAQANAISSLESALGAASGFAAIQDAALSTSGEQLANANNQVQVLNVAIKQQKTKSTLDKILWGAAGVGMGFLASRH